MSCDHIIALHHPRGPGDENYLLKLSELPAAKKRCRAAFEKWAANPHAHPRLVALGEAKSDIDLLRDDLDVLKFCPSCGERNALLT